MSLQLVFQSTSVYHWISYCLLYSFSLWALFTHRSFLWCRQRVFWLQALCPTQPLAIQCQWFHASSIWIASNVIVASGPHTSTKNHLSLYLHYEMFIIGPNSGDFQNSIFLRLTSRNLIILWGLFNHQG